ncbi:MAG: DNA polymerase III subunit delta [bacterium]
MPTLTHQHLLQEIKNGKFRPVYYLVGEEQLLKQDALSLLREKINPGDFNYLEASAWNISADDVISLARTPPVFAAIRLIIIKACEKLSAAGKTALAGYMEQPCDTTCLVLVSGARKAKEDTLFPRAEKTGAAAVYWSFRENEAEGWILSKMEKTGRKMDRDAAHAMVDSLGTDTLRLSTEIEKLLLYTEGSRHPVSSENVMNSLGFSKDESPFELGRAVMAQNSVLAAELIEKLMRAGEEPVRLLGLISGALRKVAKAKRLLEAGTGTERIFLETGVNRFYDRDFISWVKSHRDEEHLIRALGKCLEAEALFKSSSGRDPEITLKQLLCDIIPAHPVSGR